MISYDVCDAIRDRVLVMGPCGTMEIPYDWWFSGPDGAGFKLLPAENVPDSYVAEAKACLRRNRDVVSIRVVRP